MINNMKTDEVILHLKYKNKEEEDYMRKKLAEYYSIYPQDKNSDSDSFHSHAPDYEDRCKKITEMYNSKMLSYNKYYNKEM